MAYGIDDYLPENPREEEAVRDAAIDEAKEAIWKFFEENDERVYYITQLEVIFESKPWRFFHWITYKAVNELIEEKLLGCEEVEADLRSTVKFVFNKRFRDHKMPIRRSLEVLKSFSEPRVSQGCGFQAEILFFNALVGRGFIALGKNTNKFEGKEWKDSKHDLDFVVGRDGHVYGCEIKNKWSYIAKTELLIKLEICKYLGIKPLFIMRNSPQSYNWEIYKNGGYAMIFVAQIYPFGQEKLVEKIKDVLGLPADCPKAIPSGIIDRFILWHQKRISSGKNTKSTK